jgi:hypothetical protein
MKTLSKAVGAGTANIDVPEDGDTFNVPAHLEAVAQGALDAAALAMYAPRYWYSGKPGGTLSVPATGGYVKFDGGDFVAKVDGVGLFLWYANITAPASGAKVRTKIVREAFGSLPVDPTAYRDYGVSGSSGDWLLSGTYFLKLEAGRTYTLHYDTTANITLATRYFKCLTLPMPIIFDGAVGLLDDTGLGDLLLP